jgi:hypothetical protein
MLLFMADRDPSWRITANACVGEFLRNPEKRTKSSTPDLGRYYCALHL